MVIHPSFTNPSCLHKIWPTLDLNLWIDASTSCWVSLGYLETPEWLVHKRPRHWLGRCSGNQICCHVAGKQQVNEACLKVNCGNMSMIHSIQKGLTEPCLQQLLTAYFSTTLASANLFIEPKYILSSLNKADIL